ncbi:MAG TPA: MAPEG family protein [Rhizomicrobium sp.]|nr:MAPEG family protein [Rhizomicrobium sp.]
MHTTAMPVTLVTGFITVLALIFYFWTGMGVATMRGKHKVDAPTMTGPLEFESAVRVQMNTLERLVVYLPLLWLATIYFSPAMTIVYLSWLPALLGIIWIIGRWMYMSGYMAAPNKRSSGFLISGIAIIGLLICAIVGLVMTWTAVSAV